MLSKTSPKDAAKDKAAELVSAAADAAEAGREKLAPVVENVTGQLSEAADKAANKASEATAPHVAKAKESAAEASDAAAPKLAEAKESAKKSAKRAAEEATNNAAPKVKKAKREARKTAKTAKKSAKKTAKQARKNAPASASLHKAQQAAAARAEAAGLDVEQARKLFNDEWMPRVHEAIAAAGAAGTSAYAALPDRARDTVETVVPQVAKKRRKKGKVLIALGLLAGAGAVALYVSGQQKNDRQDAKQAAPEVPEVERRDVQAAEGAPAVSSSDDAVGDLEKKVDASVSGSRRGRHAAKE
ncbi:hypothetical protein [Flexivirga sp. B27]